MSLHPSWLALVALVPAAATWWTGHRLLRRLDDPALPELLLQRRSRIGALWGLTLLAILVLDARQAAWAIPLMLGAMLVAGYPAQRVLLDERWSIWAYLWHSLRRLAGGITLWVVLVIAPSVVLGARDTRTATLLAAGFATTLLLWLHHYRRIWLWTHGATPLGARPGLDERFAAVMAKATTPPPLLYRFGQPGERRAAAFALPSAGHTGAVVFSDALLELLTADEVAAVFAHEVAHLEQYTPRRMRRLRILSSLLIVVILALSLVGQRWAPGAHPFLSLGCGVAVIVALALRASRSKGHETESDLRGAALCGDPEALVRALTKLHVALRLPRRWPADVERTATHPSLVHRIAALRAATAPTAGVAAPDAAALAEPVLLPSLRAGSYVVLDATRIHLFDGVPADAVPAGDAPTAAMLGAGAADSRSLAYERLSRLSLEEDRVRGAVRLVVAERGGGRWSIPLAADDALRARTALEVVDVRVGPLPSASFTAGRLASAIAAGAAALALFVAGQLGVLVLPAAAALFLPGAASLGGLGAAAAARAAIALSTGAPQDAQSRLVLAGILVIGVLALVVAWRVARDARREAAALAERGADGSRATRGALAASGVPAAAYAAAALWVAVTVLPAASTPLLRTLAALLLGLAAATALRPAPEGRRWSSASSVAAAAGSLAVLLVARALDGATAAPALAWRDEAGRVVASAAIPELARDLVLAPAGARYVVRTFESYDEEDAMDEDAASGPPRPRLMLGELGAGAAAARPRPIDGLAAGFVADDSLVVLVARGDSARARSLELQLSPLTAGPQGPTPAAPAWRLALPALLAPELRVNAATRRWSVTGRLASAARLAVTLEGTVGAPAYRQRGWAQAAQGTLGAAFGSVTPLGDGSALAVRLRGSYGAIPLLSLVGATPWTSEIWRVGDARARRVAILPGFVRCAAGGGRVAAAACVTTDVRGRSRLDALDAAGEMQTLTSATGPVSGLAVAPDGRVAVAVAGRRELLLLDPSRHTATRLALPAIAGVAAEVQWTPAGDVAVIGYGERGTTVAVVK